MGHRKKHAPRRGSLAFRPRARNRSPVPKVRYWPELAEPKLAGFSGYKAGMTYGYVLENNPVSPKRGKEISFPLTVIETPPLWVCAIRAYQDTAYGLKTFTEAWSKSLPKDIGRAVKPPAKMASEEALAKIEKTIDTLCDLRALVSTNPRDAAVPKKKPEIMEIPVCGKTLEEKFNYAKSILGKKVQVSDVFNVGQFVDVISVSKGKGIAGPVKRFGVRILQNKSRKTVRGVGCIGAWNPSVVMSTVPRAGQMGYAQRVEFNKQIVKLGEDGGEITPRSGFLRYGTIKGPYLIVKGSVPGPYNRFIRIRHAARSPEKVQEPQLTYIHV